MIRKSSIATILASLVCLSASASPVMPGLIRAAQNRGSVLLASPPVSSAAYRTIIIFPDNQYQSRDCVGVDGERCIEWDASLDWIRDNKVSENIDLIAYVGDVIDAGDRIPPSKYGGSADACDFPPYTPSEAVCNLAGSLAACDLVSDCKWFDNGFGTTACISCATGPPITAELEWTEWDLRVNRLEPAGDIDIPWVTTWGNGDNAGKEFATNPNREPLGFEAYNAAYWAGLEAGYGGTSVYDHVATNLDVNGDGHAWVVSIGSQPMLFVAIPYVGGQQISAAMQTWVGTQCAAHPTLPVVVLAHDVGEIFTTITSASETFCPNMVFAFGGHTGTSRKTQRTDGANVVFEIVDDWTNLSSNDSGGNPQNDYFVVLRLYFDSSPTQIEAFDFSAQSSLRELDAGGTNTIALQDFDLSVPALYDLSAYEAVLAAEFDAKGSPRPAFATPPQGALTTTVISTDDCATLQSLDGGTSQHIQVTAAITNCSLALSGTDIWLEMTGSGSVSSTGNHSFTGGTRIKVTGGSLSSTATATGVTFGGTDILIDNTNLPIYSIYVPVSQTVTRLTIMNTTIDTVGWGTLIENDDVTGTVRNSDIMFLNVDLDAAMGGGHGGIRLQDVNRFLMVDSLLHSNSSGSCFRAHADSRFIAATGNVFEAGAGDCLNWTILYAHENNPPPGQPGNLGPVYIGGNDLVATDAAITRPGGGAYFIPGTPPTDSTCDDIEVAGNNVYTGTADTFFFYDSANTFCTNLTHGAANNNMIDYTGSAYDPMTDCSTMGCGSDH